MEETYHLFLHIIETLPYEWKVAFFGMFGAAFVSLWLRRFLPLDLKQRSLWVHLGGFVFASFTVICFVPTIFGVHAALAVGLSGPWIGGALIGFLEEHFPYITKAIEVD